MGSRRSSERLGRSSSEVSMTLYERFTVRARFVASVVATAAVAVAAPMARAQQRPDGPPREPPAVAFTACASRSAGQTCSLEFMGRTITGTCTATPDARLFCRPEGMPPPPSDR
jgi:hypothetical protein